MNAIRGKLNHIKSNLNLRRILGLVNTAASGWFYFTILMIFIETAVFFASLYLIKLLIDVVSKSQANLAIAKEEIFKYIILAGIAGILYYVIKAFTAYLTELQSVKVAEHINENIHDKAVTLDLSFYESPNYFDTLKRAMDAGADRPSLVITTLIEIAKNTLSLLAIASVLLTIDWMLIPLLAVFVLPTLAVRLYYARKLNELRIQQTSLERKSSYYSSLITTDTSAKEIRTFNLGRFLKDNFVQIRQLLVKDKLRITLKRTKLEAITTAMSSIGIYVCIGYIALKTIKGETSVGDITLFLVAFPQTFSILQNIASGISIVYQNSIFINSIFELLDLKNTFPEAQKPIPIPAEHQLDLKLNNVSFQYPHSEKQILNNINITIPAGKIIALVGLNGAGKSTLIKLLCRLYDPVSGSITLGDIDIKNFNSAAYKQQISVVFQDFCKYSFTASDNIYFGDIHSPLSKENIIKAAKRSGANLYIEKFPKQYDTVMGRIFEDGHEVSIGQWQKLALARCFYSDARILILDEATSALDAVSEKELFEQFRETIGNRAAVIISHRHSAVKHADYIYVLSQGQILQEGTDEELLKMEGDYARLFKNKTKITA